MFFPPNNKWTFDPRRRRAAHFRKLFLFLTLDTSNSLFKNGPIPRRRACFYLTRVFVGKVLLWKYFDPDCATRHRKVCRTQEEISAGGTIITLLIIVMVTYYFCQHHHRSHDHLRVPFSHVLFILRLFVFFIIKGQMNRSVMLLCFVRDSGCKGSIWTHLSTLYIHTPLILHGPLLDIPIKK